MTAEPGSENNIDVVDPTIEQPAAPAPEPGAEPPPEPASAEPVAEPAPPAADAPAAPDVVADDAPIPMLADGSDIDWDKLSLTRIRKIMSGEEKLGQPGQQSAAPAADADPNAQQAAPATLEDSADVPVFNFTPDADYDTFSTELSTYLAAEGVAPEVKTIAERLQAEIAAAREAGLAPEAAALSSALDTLVTFKPDPEEPTRFVPNTDGLIGLLQKEFPKEVDQVIADLNSLPSAKYQGLTRFQEFIMEHANLDAPAMKRLDTFLQNGGRLDYPSFTPAGISEAAAEAFWTSGRRDEIAETVEKALFTINSDPEATAAEKETAKAELANINADLAKTQRGIDAEKQARAAEQNTIQTERQAIHNGAVDRFINTTRGIIGIIAKDAVKGVDVLDETGAGLTGTAVGTLIETAFSDNEGYAQYAREQLKNYGITADWNKAIDLRDKLFQAETQLEALTRGGAHPRAIENAKKAKDGVVKEMIGLAREASGKINAKIVASAGKKMKAAVGDAPAGTQAAAPRTPAGGPAEAPKGPNFDEMSLEQIREWRRDPKNNPFRQAVMAGDLSGFGA